MDDDEQRAFVYTAIAVAVCAFGALVVLIYAILSR